MKGHPPSPAVACRLKPGSLLLVTLLGVAAGTGSVFLRPRSPDPVASVAAAFGPHPPQQTGATTERPAEAEPARQPPQDLARMIPIKPGNLQQVERKLQDEMDEMKRSDLGNGELYQGLLRTPDAPSLRAHGIDAAKLKQLQDISDRHSSECFKAMHDRMQRDSARSDPEHGVLAWIIPGDPTAAEEMKAALRNELATAADPELADEIITEKVLQGRFGYFGATDTLISVELPTDDAAIGKKRYTYSESEGRDLGRVSFSYRNPETNRADNGAQMDATPEGISSFYGDFFTDLLNP
ncbi:MAG: hypothetical protein JWO82_2873 [Akkermansiaceae bacterium]|nr:hypothetical protein [Akkermansiaceae bacterium]